MQWRSNLAFLCRARARDSTRTADPALWQLFSMLKQPFRALWRLLGTVKYISKALGNLDMREEPFPALWQHETSLITEIALFSSV